MTFEEKTISSEVIYEGKILTLKRDLVETVSGESYRELVVHGGGAVILAIKNNGKVLMVRQYRKAIDRVVLELPAGKIENGEDPKLAAARELEEETGYKSDNLSLLTKYYTNCGYDNELLYMYFARNLEKGQTNYDPDEAIDIVEYELDELYQMVMSGEIQDGKTIIGILMAQELFR